MLKLLGPNNQEFGEINFFKHVKMSVKCNEAMRIGRNSEVGKLVVVGIFYDDVPGKMGLGEGNIWSGA